MSRKRKQKPTPLEQAIEQRELEDAGTKLIEADTIDHMAELLKANAEIVDRLQQIQSQLTQPRNDPEYLKALEERDALRSAAANHIQSVHIWRDPEKDETWLGISTTNRHEHHRALEVARIVGHLFEAE